MEQAPKPYLMSLDGVKRLASILKLDEEKDAPIVYEAYRHALDGFVELCKGNKALAGVPINHVQLLLYLFNENAFYHGTHPGSDPKELIKNEQYLGALAGMSLDKYVTNEHLSFQNPKLVSQYNPEISTIALYLNFILGMLSRYKKGEPKNTLVVDVMNKAFTMCKCIVLLLSQGFETEAFSTWRTLHENECILTVLVKYGQPVMESYLRHLRYAMAFRGGLGDKEKTDECFLEIKEGMKKADLKSKDMKRYIEYGWLLDIPNIESLEEFRLNFRDGVERAAGLHEYAKVYEMSSEIAHSSPLLIYSRKNYFHLVALLNLYESFFRLEKIFSSIYLSSVSEEEMSRYKAMREMYLPQLKTAYALTRARFSKFSKKEG